jgi:hypothetical protein
MSSIDGVTISWLRTRALPLQFATGAGLPCLGRQGGYFTAFAGAAGAGAWRKPWIGETSYSYFWARALGPNYVEASADKAWKRQVPLRGQAPPILCAAVRDVDLMQTVFAYPSGVGVAVTAKLMGPHDPTALLALVGRLADEPFVTGAGFTKPRAIAAVLGGLLDDAERALLGTADPGSVGELEPVTIATVTATTDWPAAVICQGDGVHRLLEGLCQLSAAPLTGSVGNLTTELFDEASRPGTTRMAIGSGRAIWSPQRSSTSAGGYRLGCYHENQILAALQASVLLDTARWASAYQVSSLGGATQQLLRPVVNLLGMLYGKVSDMYASAFVRRQIDESGLVPTIGQQRIELGFSGRLS